MTADATLEALKEQRPEWGPWLAVVDEVVREAANEGWSAAVPAAPPAAARVTPLLDGMTLAIDTEAVRRLLDGLLRTAATSGTAPMATMARVVPAHLDIAAVFRDAMRHDAEAIASIAATAGADAGALQAVVALLPVPFLQACQRQWARGTPPVWVRGCCPVCGSWPAFAEIRGIERARYYRCGRCGGEWHARALWCPFCDMHDHHQLVALVAEEAGAHASIDACRRCLGYVKTFTRLQGCAPAAVMIEDLASVELDLAALGEGFARPAGAGAACDVTVIDQPPPRRFFGWRK